LRIQNITRGTVLADRAVAARSIKARTVGLLGRSSLEPGEALLLEPSSSIHTAFMRFPIDIVYVDRSGRVVKVVPDLRPFRISAVFRGGRSVIELPSGTVAQSGTAVGDELSFQT